MRSRNLIFNFSQRISLQVCVNQQQKCSSIVKHFMMCLIFVLLDVALQRRKPNIKSKRRHFPRYRSRGQYRKTTIRQRRNPFRGSVQLRSLFAKLLKSIDRKIMLVKDLKLHKMKIDTSLEELQIDPPPPSPQDYHTMETSSKETLKLRLRDNCRIDGQRQK